MVITTFKFSVAKLLSIPVSSTVAISAAATTSGVIIQSGVVQSKVAMSGSSTAVLSNTMSVSVNEN